MSYWLFYQNTLLLDKIKVPKNYESETFCDKEVSKELELNYYSKYLNKEVEVLVEETKDGYSFGHTGNYLYVKINKELKHNTFVTVKITDIEYPYCIGEVE